MPLIGKADRDTVFRERPELLDQPVVALMDPLSLEERDDRRSALEEFAAIAPSAVRSVDKRHPFRIAAVPGVLGLPDLLDRGFAREGRPTVAGRAQGVVSRICERAICSRRTFSSASASARRSRRTDVPAETSAAVKRG